MGMIFYNIILIASRIPGVPTVWPMFSWPGEVLETLLVRGSGTRRAARAVDVDIDVLGHGLYVALPANMEISKEISQIIVNN